MSCTIYFRKAMLAAFLGAGMAFSSHVKAAETPVKATSMAESPTDGSVWIGSAGQGLYRLGRNGRQIKYLAADGHIPSDSIKTLFFDRESILWILDNRGQFTCYSATSGFEKANIEKGKIDCAIYDSKADIIYFGSGKSLKTYKNVSKKTSELAGLPASAKSLKMADEGGNFVWVFTEEGVLKVGLDGSIQRWEEAPEILDLLPYTFETNQRYNTVEGRKPGASGKVILWSVLALILGAVTGWLLKKPTRAPAPVTQTIIEKPVNPTSPVKPAQTEVINKPEEPIKTEVPEQPEKPAETIIPETIEEPAPEKKAVIQPKTEESRSQAPKGPFTKKVYALIKDHLSEPDFDVESIATLTGISRIHVNRKLRQEGAPAPSALIKEARMHHAARLIRQGKLGMSQISSLCGFRTPSYFATAFKEFFGVSPSEFTEEK